MKFVACEGGEVLDLANDVVREEADGTGGEGRQTGQTSGGVAGELSFEFSEDVAFKDSRTRGVSVRDGLTVCGVAAVGL